MKTPLIVKHITASRVVVICPECGFEGMKPWVKYRGKWLYECPECGREGQTHPLDRQG